MTENDPAKQFSLPHETSNSSVAPRPRRRSAPTAARKKRKVRNDDVEEEDVDSIQLFPSPANVLVLDSDQEDDDDYHPGQKSKKDSDSETSSVQVIGSLLAERNAKKKKSRKAPPPTPAARAPRKSHNRQLTLDEIRSSLIPSDSADKRNTENQLLSQPSILTHDERTTSATDPASLPRRDGTAVAERRQRTLRSEPWAGVRTMCDFMGFTGRFAAMDIGRVNFGFIKVFCSSTGFVIEDWQLIKVDDICKSYQKINPTEMYSTKDDFGIDEVCACLCKWARRVSADCDAVFIEEQRYLKEMVALQTAAHMGVIEERPAIVVRRNDPELDVLMAANSVSRAVIVSANSVKTCYAAFYPRVTETRAAVHARAPHARLNAFGVGDHVRGDPNEAKQYAENKKNSIRFGEKIVPVRKIVELLGARMSSEQRKKFLGPGLKKDDIYDALWLVLYGVETWLPALYAWRKRGHGGAIMMYGGIPQRRYRTYDALFEFARGVGTPPAVVKELEGVLETYRRSADIDEESE